MRVRFIPQWDFYPSIITLGRVRGDEYEVGIVPDDIGSRSHEADRYAYHDNAPLWVRNWPGPFEIEILREEPK